MGWRPAIWSILQKVLTADHKVRIEGDIAFPVAGVAISQETDGTTNKVQARNAAHDDFNANANLQIANTDVGGANQVPVLLSAETTKVIGVVNNKYEDITFHDEAIVMASGLEFNVLDYKSLRLSITGDATTLTLMFRGQVGAVVDALQGIESNTLVLASSVTETAIGTIYDFDIEGYEKVWFGLSDVAGGSVTVKGRAVN